MKDMNNQNNKSTWALVLSIIAIALCVLVFLLWIFEVMPHTVISPETFIGACIALLGVIVTIAVGTQIVNVMEIKSAKKVFDNELKIALDHVKRQQLQIEEDRIRNAHLHHCTMAMIAEFRTDYPQAIYYFFGALLTGLQMHEPLDNEKFVLEHIESCLRNCKDCSKVSQQWRIDLKNIDATIQQLPNYRWIKDKYEPLRDDYFKKIGI